MIMYFTEVYMYIDLNIKEGIYSKNVLGVI